MNSKKDKMTSRQRILAVLKGQQPDRIPWMPLCSYSYFGSVPDYTAGADYLSAEGLKTRIDFYNNVIKADYLQWSALFYNLNCSAKVEIHRSQSDNKHRTEYRTPVGIIAEETSYSDVAKTWFHSKMLLERAEDMKVFQYVVENQTCQLDERLFEHLKILGQAGVIFLYVPPPPLKDMLLHYLKLENAVYIIQDNKNIFDDLVTAMDARNQQIYKIMADTPGEVFNDSAVTGTGMISPNIFNEYYLPYTKRYAEILHSKGKLYTNHTSGEPLWGIVNMINDSNIDALYGVADLGQDDTIDKLCKGLKNNITIIGGGLAPNFLATSSIEEIKEKTKNVLSKMLSGGRFMLGTDDDTVYGTPCENLKAVGETVEQYGSIDDMKFKRQGKYEYV
ncbi:MAG: hypothetical protein A2Y10_10590 [Planctomycetes bacterium GWF2_41_51]|nr:MAG: hypothetical protein A2Y10_10590 [Planctomycetes bacterium GWF2_41_51]